LESLEKTNQQNKKTGGKKPAEPNKKTSRK
jgi:hypothetical protein